MRIEWVITRQGRVRSTSGTVTIGVKQYLAKEEHRLPSNDTSGDWTYVEREAKRFKYKAIASIEAKARGGASIEKAP